MPVTPESGLRREASLPIFFYFGASTILLLLVAPDGSWLDVATAYMLQIKLHASAPQVSAFRLLTGIPIYIGFLFGLVRDLWSPFGLRDRGYLRLFSVLTALVLVGLALFDVQYASLFLGVLLVSICTRFLLAAQQGLMGLVAQEHLMSGRMAALFSACYFIPLILGALFAGVAVDAITPKVQFLGLAVVALAVGVFGLWSPKSVFDRAYDQPEAQGMDLLGDLRRLFSDKAALAAVAMIFLWQFAPGLQTVMQFHLTEHLGAPESAFGYWTAIYYASFLPGVIGYGYVCQRVPFGRLGTWAILASAPLNLVLPELVTADQLMWFAIPLGLTGGAAFAALYDIAMRACPAGLHGALMMAVAGGNQLGWRAGDAFGTWIYAAGGDHGFLYASIGTAITSGAAPLFLALAPRNLLVTRDGESLSGNPTG
jgi:Major Facilitator Superfamily